MIDTEGALGTRVNFDTMSTSQPCRERENKREHTVKGGAGKGMIKLAWRAMTGAL